MNKANTTPQTGLFDTAGMTGLLIAAVAAALAVGILSMLIIMPGGPIPHALLGDGAKGVNAALMLAT